MRKNKKIIVMLMAIMLVASLFGGCGKKQTASTNNMIEVQDQLGRKVKIKNNPTKNSFKLLYCYFNSFRFRWKR
ncbi:hypothetical protein [Clostridium haemolyticum]|uniref:hypothetical protein n=1 Tax=Clostridium haemolyticum TaxID=84025 RepID=UPI001FA8B6D9|nr:hypothetical protein [Clostridium haemolyticum]